MEDKIIYTEGCICGSLDINKFSASGISIEEKRRICHKIVDQLYDESDLERLLIDTAQEYGEPTYIGTCDECGDSIYTYTLTL